jgi:hypothetical protein
VHVVSFDWYSIVRPVLRNRPIANSVFRFDIKVNFLDASSDASVTGELDVLLMVWVGRPILAVEDEMRFPNLRLVVDDVIAVVEPDIVILPRAVCHRDRFVVFQFPAVDLIIDANIDGLANISPIVDEIDAFVGL